jgi:Tol biopolymer transport system component
MKKGCLLIVVLLCTLLLSKTPATAARTALISKSSSGEIGNSDSYNPSISGNGNYTVFESTSSNLVDDDNNNRRDIFIHNRTIGTTDLVSISSIGTQGNNDSYHGVISADGSTIAFMSTASDLVAEDNGGFSDIFIYERANQNTTRISVSKSGEEGDGHSDYPALSEDGRYVVFQSAASNLVANDTNNKTDIFRYDRQAGVTARISLDFQNMETTDGDSTRPVISGSGRYIAFQSDADLLVPCDDNSRNDVFLRDMITNTLTRVSVGTYACQANNHSYRPGISADGRYVIFDSYATNLLIWDNSDDTNGQRDVFVHDTQELVTERVSVSSSGVEGDSSSGGYGGSLSSDGQYVVFNSRSSNLVPDDTNGTYDIFARDRNTNRTSRESVGHYWEEGSDGYAENSSLSSNGRYIAFASTASTLVSGDTNGRRDVFVRDYLWPGPLVTQISPSSGDFHGGTVLIISGENFQTGATVHIDNTSALAISVSSSTRITCITPPHAPGGATVTVTNPDGQRWIYPIGHGFSGYVYRPMTLPWMMIIL